MSIHVGINPLFENRAIVPEIERMGFDSVWVSEHILFHGPVNEAITALASFAAQTTTIGLGTAIYLMPLRHPTITAKTVATLDVLAGPRVILGVGVGGEYVKEFEATGVPVKQRGGRTDEAIQIVKRLWRDDNVTFNGKYYQLDEVTMEPKPSRGGPPVWVAGRSDAAIRRAALYGDGYLPYLFTPERYATSLAKVRDQAATAGRDPASIAAAHYLFFCIGDSREEAKRRAGDQLTENYQQDFHPMVDRFVAHGTAADCAEFAARFVQGGARSIILIPVTPRDEMPDQVRRAGAELLPLIRDLA